MGDLDGDVHAYCYCDHDIRSKDKEDVIEEESSKKNKPSHKCIELDVLFVSFHPGLSGEEEYF